VNRGVFLIPDTLKQFNPRLARAACGAGARARVPDTPKIAALTSAI
jgi:hypothetical protein